MRLLLKNIKELIQVRPSPLKYVSGTGMRELPTIQKAFLLIENGQILNFGQMEDYQEQRVDKTLDLSHQMIFPCWCDAHTHLVYAGNREGEFVDRIKGLSYEEIAKRGGGILNSAKNLQQCSEKELYDQSSKRLEEVIQQGTGAIEIKSGYGLDMEGELKMLRVIRRLKENYPIPIKATFLAAHALPTAYKKDKQAFLDLMLKEVLPIVAKEELAEFIDVFCETGYFDIADTHQILEAGSKFGLKPKIHVNQFNAFGGIKKAIAFNALSVDHLEVFQDEDLAVLKESQTMPVALPGCSFFLGIPYTPARRIIDEGLPIALSSDYNPGSAPSGNMHFVVSTACIKMKMTPAEAINAATLNAAYAMGLEAEVGSISIGKRANFFITEALSSYAFLPYSFGKNHIKAVYLDGKAFTPQN